MATIVETESNPQGHWTGTHTGLIDGKGLDGLNSDVSSKERCAVAAKGSSPRAWHAMKLDANKYIKGVQLARRTQCCSDQGKNVKIQVGSGLQYNDNDPVCKEISILSGTGLVDYWCDNVHEGQYVILSTDQAYLTICEARVLTGNLLMTLPFFCINLILAFTTPADDDCALEQDVNLPQTSMVGFAWGIADAQSCISHCGSNHPEATHFTWFDYRTNHQLAGQTDHKCNCKKDVTTKIDEVGAVSGVVDCDMKGKCLQLLQVSVSITVSDTSCIFILQRIKGKPLSLKTRIKVEK